MATQNPSQQQTADRSQGSAGGTQQGGGQAAQRGQAGAYSAATQGQAGGAQGPGATQGHGGTYGQGAQGAPGYGQVGRAGSAQSRYGVQPRGGGYDVSPFGGYTAGPFTLMHRISEEMDRLFESFGMGRNFFPEEMAQGRGGGRAPGVTSLWSPHLEVCERNGRLLIQVDLPGVSREDVNVQIEPDAVIIQGQRTQQSERSDQGYYHSERSYGSFYRTVPLPEGIDVDQATATFRNGVLEVEMPMPQQKQRGRKLEVREGDDSRARSAVGGEHTSGGTR
jgi:HSP20 family protein